MGSDIQLSIKASSDYTEKIVRTITFSSRYAHTQPLFSLLKILNVYQINKLITSLFVFKSLNNLIDFENLFHFSNEFHNRALRDPLRLRPPQVRSTRSQQSIVNNGCRIWNELPLNIRESTSLNIFKNNIKRYLQS